MGGGVEGEAVRLQRDGREKESPQSVPERGAGRGKRPGGDGEGAWESEPGEEEPQPAAPKPPP